MEDNTWTVTENMSGVKVLLFHTWYILRQSEIAASHQISLSSCQYKNEASRTFTARFLKFNVNRKFLMKQLPIISSYINNPQLQWNCIYFLLFFLMKLVFHEELINKYLCFRLQPILEWWRYPRKVGIFTILVLQQCLLAWLPVYSQLSASQVYIL